MSESSLTIRPERPEDRERVYEIVESAFGRPDEANIVAALRGRVEPEISLVAAMREPGGERLVGHIYFSPVEVGDARRLAMGLAPVSVEPEFQNRAVGSQLCRRGLESCLQIGQPLVFVLGHPGYYPRFSFVAARPKGCFYQSRAFDAAFFVAELRPGAANGFSGEVFYQPEFGG